MRRPRHNGPPGAARSRPGALARTWRRRRPAPARLTETVPTTSPTPCFHGSPREQIGAGISGENDPTTARSCLSPCRLPARSWSTMPVSARRRVSCLLPSSVLTRANYRFRASCYRCRGPLAVELSTPSARGPRYWPDVRRQLVSSAHNAPRPVIRTRLASRRLVLHGRLRHWALEEGERRQQTSSRTSSPGRVGSSGRSATAPPTCREAISSGSPLLVPWPGGRPSSSSTSRPVRSTPARTTSSSGHSMT